MIKIYLVQPNFVLIIDHIFHCVKITTCFSIFQEYSDLFELPRQLPGSRTGWLAFPVRIRKEAPFERREFQVFLEQRNIQTRVVFTGNILRQPGFADIDCKVDAAGYPVADAVMRGGVLLGCHHGLTPEMMAHVHDSVRIFLDRFH